MTNTMLMLNISKYCLLFLTTLKLCSLGKLLNLSISCVHFKSTYAAGAKATGYQACTHHIRALHLPVWAQPSPQSRANGQASETGPCHYVGHLARVPSSWLSLLLAGTWGMTGRWQLPPSQNQSFFFFFQKHIHYTLAHCFENYIIA